MREKSQSHRDIPRGRSERREVSFNEPSQRTRSLTREEASLREVPGERTASSQRLPTGRPSRADSRVTFALDTMNNEKSEKPDSKRQWSKEQLPITSEPSKKLEEPKKPPQSTTVVVTPPSGGRPSLLGTRSRPIPFSKDKSPSPMTIEDVTEETDKSMERDRARLSPTVALRTNFSEFRDDSMSPIRTLQLEEEEDMLHGSSEFMIVLYPDDEVNGKDLLQNEGREPVDLLSKKGRSFVGEFLLEYLMNTWV